MDMLINKPQFNAKAFIPGTAISVKTNDRNEWYGFNYVCLVNHMQPLSINVTYIDKSNNVQNRMIPVEKVADGTLKIKFMKELEEE